MDTLIFVARAARTVLLCLLALIAVALGAGQSKAVTITPSASIVQVGDVFDVVVAFEATDTIGAFLMFLSGDSSLVTRTGQTGGSVFSGLTEGVDYLVDSVSVSAAGFDTTVFFASDQNGPASFLTVSYAATEAGTAVFDLAALIANSLVQDPFEVTASTTVLVEPATAVIPLPASGLLFIAALAGLLRLRFKSA